MFSRNNKPFKFRLINLTADVRQEIKKLILNNGGEVVNIDDRLVPNFTVPDKYIAGKAMYDIAFVKDCVKFSEIQDLHQYKLGPQKEYSGCIMSIFLYESRSCMHRSVSNPCPQTYICSACGSRNTFIMLDVSEERDSVIASKRSCNKDPDTIFGNKAHHGPKRPKVVPSTSYAVSSDDSDVQEITTLGNDRLSCKQNDDDNEASTASTSEIEISSDDSEANPYIKVKDKNKNASHRSMSELHINCVERNVNTIKWITRIKNKVKNMERPRTRNFANWEKWEMLIFLIENIWIERAKGYDVWQHMIRRKNWNHRTKMSLNNHFLKSILPSIEAFQLPKEIEIRFVNLRNKKSN